MRNKILVFNIKISKQILVKLVVYFAQYIYLRTHWFERVTAQYKIHKTSGTLQTNIM